MQRRSILVACLKLPSYHQMEIAFRTSHACDWAIRCDKHDFCMTVMMFQFIHLSCLGPTKIGDKRAAWTIKGLRVSQLWCNDAPCQGVDEKELARHVRKQHPDWSCCALAWLSVMWLFAIQQKMKRKSYKTHESTYSGLQVGDRKYES